MCKVCGSTEKLMPTGETYREGSVRYKSLICPICDSKEFEIVTIHKKVKKNRFLNYTAASITAMGVFIGTFYVFTHLEKFTSIFDKY